jgi:hypothetical protein
MKPQARMMLPAAPSTTTRPTTTSKAASMSHGHAEFLRTVTTTSRIGSLPRVGSLRRPYTPRCAAATECCSEAIGGLSFPTATVRRGNVDPLTQTGPAVEPVHLTVCRLFVNGI